MAASSLSEKPEDIDLEERAAFLSAAPRSGELSPSAQKLTAEAFVWLCSIVVFGSSADLARNNESCSAKCGVDIAAGVISFALISILLLGHLLMWSNTIDRSAWLTSSAEMRMMVVFSFWWIVGVSVASSVPNDGARSHATGVTIVFAWLCLFGSIFGAYKAYHASKEELKILHNQQIMSFQATEEEEYANFS